jgi:hypothetical protein
MAVAATLLSGVYAAIHSLALPTTDRTADDTRFLLTEVRSHGASEPVVVNLSLGSMDGFRILFYARDAAQPIHNLDWLPPMRTRRREIIVLTRARDLDTLEGMGDVETLAASARSRREADSGDRLTLFRLRFRPDLVQRPLPERITPMQAMDRG